MVELRAFTMPKWGIEMTEGTIAEWMVAEGQAFARGDILTLIETDKITNEVEAEFDLVMARQVVAAGTVAPVGALLAVFADGQATPAAIDAFIGDFQPADTRMAADIAQPVAVALPPRVAPVIPDGLAISPAAVRHALQSQTDLAAINGSGRNGRITLQDVLLNERPAATAPSVGPVAIMPLPEPANAFASPLARRLAVQHGVDLSIVQGTGPRGRICRRDVLERVAAATPAPVAASAIDGPYAVVPMTTMRKAIARQLTLSKQSIPHFYLRFSVQIDALNQMRAQARQATGAAPSINDYLLRAVALALVAHPDVNIQVHGQEVHRFASANIAVAVETPKGLVTPVLRAADTKSVSAISAEVRAMADRARAGRTQADEMQGGSFTVSNLGMFGIENFDAIINPPQGAILAVGAAMRKPVDANHAIAFATVAALSLSCDHRAIDGGAGARFCRTLKELLEDPTRLTA